MDGSGADPRRNPPEDQDHAGTETGPVRRLPWEGTGQGARLCEEGRRTRTDIAQ